MSKSESHFTGWRKLIFPVHGHEMPKLLPMFLMSFLTCFNYSLLRNLKDSLVITAKSSGAEVIPFIKLWGILPAAILATSLFNWLSNRYSRPQVFSMIISSFLIYFLTFAFILYPSRELFHPHQLADHLQNILPEGFMGLVAMFRNWTFSLFYIIAEMWGTVVLGILFWGFANEITRVSEARRFYGVLGIGSNLAAVAAGKLGMTLSFTELQPSLPFGTNPWEQSMMALLLVIAFSGCLILCIYQWMLRMIRRDNLELQAEHAMPKKKKKRMGFFESLGFVSKSSYLRNMAVIVVAYNLVINLVEVMWKGQLKLLYPAASDYNHFMNLVTMVIGILSAMTALFMATLIRGLGWTRTALIAPIILLVTGVGFFGCMFLPESWLNPIILATGALSPLGLVVYFGAAQNCLSKAAKYSVFDTTKEIAFIPLDSDLKLRGKAAIDGIGSRFGKSGSSLIQQGLILSLGSLAAIGPAVVILLALVVGWWFYAVLSVGSQFEELTLEAEERERSEAKEESSDSSTEPVASTA